MTTTSEADPWLTFGPDLLAGIIGGLFTGLVVGLVLLLVQYRTDHARQRETQIQAAYEAVLESLTRLIAIRVDRDGAAELGTLRHRLMALAELIDMREPVFAEWLEAERQLSLKRAGDAAKRIVALPQGYSPNEYAEAFRPFGIWVAKFTNNIRYWRMGKVSQQQMARLASDIEIVLRKENAWRAHNPWDAPQ